jgi:hypothetical protein
MAVPIPAVGGAERTVTPVKWWAVVGGLFLGLQIATYMRWFAMGQAHAAPKGPTPIPDWVATLARIWEILHLVGGIGVVYWFVVRPWRRDHRLSFDGKLVLIWIQLWLLQDPMENYFVHTFSYNATFINLGNWISAIPGATNFRGHYSPEPLLWTFGAYTLGMFLPMLVVCGAMRKAKQRWPQIGKVGLALVAFGMLGLFLLTLELAWIRTQQYSYLGAVRWLSLFPGTPYQYPLYNWVAWTTFWTGMTCLRYFRDDRGLTVAERGAENMKVGAKQRSGIRFLALLGLCNTMYLFMYNVPMNFFGMHAQSYPEKVLKRSYMTSGVCGLGTDYACPGPRVPFTRPGSAHATPDGRLVAPDGLPIQVPLESK